MADTNISWATDVWNPTTGCDQVSEGCGLGVSGQCYAMTLAARLKAMGNPRYQVDGKPPRSGPGFGVTLHEDKLLEPVGWKKPRRIFVNSMSDLFHEDIPDAFIGAVFATMAFTPRHQYLVLTKRPGRMASLVPRLPEIMATGLLNPPDEELDGPATLRILGWLETVPWPLPNVWLGTSVENQKWAGVRIRQLLRTPAAIRFLSCEPLLGPVNLERWLGTLHVHPSKSEPHHHGDTGRENHGHRGPHAIAHGHGESGLHWVIVGGQSGPGWQPMDPAWARTIRDQCVAAGVPFYFKQHSGPRPEMDRELDGVRWEQFPEVDAG